MAEPVYRRVVIKLSGEYLAGSHAFGIDQPWQHPNECLRLTYSQPPHIVQEGLEIIAEEVKALF